MQCTSERKCFIKKVVVFGGKPRRLNPALRQGKVDFIGKCMAFLCILLLIICYIDVAAHIALFHTYNVIALYLSKGRNTARLLQYGK